MVKNSDNELSLDNVCTLDDLCAYHKSLPGDEHAVLRVALNEMDRIGYELAYCTVKQPYRTMRSNPFRPMLERIGDTERICYQSVRKLTDAWDEFVSTILRERHMLMDDPTYQLTEREKVGEVIRIIQKFDRSIELYRLHLSTNWWNGLQMYRYVFDPECNLASFEGRKPNKDDDRIFAWISRNQRVFNRVFHHLLRQSAHLCDRPPLVEIRISLEYFFQNPPLLEENGWLFHRPISYWKEMLAGFLTMDNPSWC